MWQFSKEGTNPRQELGQLAAGGDPARKRLVETSDACLGMAAAALWAASERSGEGVFESKAGIVCVQVLHIPQQLPWQQPPPPVTPTPPMQFGERYKSFPCGTPARGKLSEFWPGFSCLFL